MDGTENRQEKGTPKKRSRKKKKSASSVSSPGSIQPSKKTKTQSPGTAAIDSQEEESGSECSDTELGPGHLGLELKQLLLSTNKEVKGLRKDIQELADKQAKLIDRIDSIEERVVNIDLRITQQGKALNIVQNDMEQTLSDVKVMDRRCSHLEKNACMMDSAIQRVNEQYNRLERRSREKNLRLVGYPESTGNTPENCVGIVQKILKDKFGMHNVDIEVAHRVGPPKVKNGRYVKRHIIFRLQHLQDKHTILQNKRQCLAEDTFFFTDDMTDADVEMKKRLKPIIEEATSANKKWKFRAGKLIIEGKLYTGPIPDLAADPVHEGSTGASHRVSTTQESDTWSLPKPSQGTRSPISSGTDNGATGSTGRRSPWQHHGAPQINRGGGAAGTKHTDTPPKESTHL